MPALAYTAPSSVEEAVRALAGASGLAKVLSGGTDLLVQLRSGRTTPSLIVDTKKIPGISGIREENGAFVIGAATPGAVIGEHEALGRAWPRPPISSVPLKCRAAHRSRVISAMRRPRRTVFQH